MKFLSITYKNYRCFQDAEIKFNTNDKQNISLVIAPNGGGKTEMLFSFWWVLYGFDFNQLKEKKDAPYALNLAKYNKLMRSPEGYEEECFVTLKFKDGGNVYGLKKTVTYTKKSNGITSKTKCVLAYKNEKGVTTPPITDTNVIENTLTRIIPRQILHGIIFDGERMKQLSTVDEDAKIAIQGIIQDITNEELFERCKTELADLRRENSKEEKRISSSFRNVPVDDIINEIESAEQAIRFAQVELEANNKEKNKIEIKLGEIAVELKKDETARELEIKRNSIKDKLNYANKTFDTFVQSFNDDLLEGYLLIGNALFDDVENSLQRKDIPEDLTADAVRGILRRTHCICGHEIGDAERAKLTEWIDSLPPDNVGSTLLEMNRQAKNGSNDVKKHLMSSFKKIKEAKEEINNLKNDLSIINSQLTGEGYSKKANELNAERIKLEARLMNIEASVKRNTSVIDNNKKLIENLKKQKESSSKNNELLQYFDKKDTLIRKFEDALEEIDKINGEKALEAINEKLDKAYMEISEDFERGRRIYIVQFDQKNKYRLVSYYAKTYGDLFLSSEELRETMRLQGKSAAEIKEALILKICEPNSTGQSKINTLAFAKAILDYSNEVRDEDSIEISKEYPFLIDSPFTELSGGNLSQSSFYIHTFSKQILLFISQDSYDDVKTNIDKYVCSVTRIKKHESDAFSFVVGGDK